MNTDTKMHAYVKPSKSRLIALLIFIALLIGCIASCSYYSAQPLPDPVPVSDQTRGGTYAYIDVQLLTDWLLEVENGSSTYTYYVAWDNAGNGYFVRMNKTTYATFSDIVAYTYDENDYNAPEPIRLHGVIRNIPSDEMTELADVFSESVDTMRSEFGNYCLNAEESPTSDGEGFSMTGALLAGVFAFIFAIVYGVQAGNYRSSLQRLNALGMSNAAAQEFENATNLVFGQQGVTLSEHYVYGSRNGTVLSTGDIVWVYKRVQHYFFIPVSTTLVANTIDGKAKILSAKCLDEAVAAEIMQQLSARNAATRFGFSMDNQRFWRDCVKAAKNAGTQQ